MSDLGLSKPAHEMTMDEVIEFAIREGHPILYRAAQMYRSGGCTWEKAMQVAAISASVFSTSQREFHAKLCEDQITWNMDDPGETAARIIRNGKND